MSKSHQDDDFGPVPMHVDLDAMMARGRRMRSEAFISGLGLMFQAPGKVLERAQPKTFSRTPRKTHA